MTNSNLPKINLDIDGIFNVALKGVRRGYVFIGIIQNMVESKNINQRDLQPSESTDFNFSFNIEKIDKKEAQDSFLHWGYNNALREVIESFESFLLELFWKILWVKDGNTINIQSLNGEIANKKEKFRKGNFPDKIKELCKCIDLKEEDRNFINSLQDIRNCITHSRSVLYKNNYRDKITISIPKFEYFIEYDDGTKEIIDKLPFKNVDREGTLCLKIKKEEKEIKERDIIYFSSREVTMICYQMTQVVNRIKIEFLNFLKTKGITVKATIS